jgi:hypothetical protein
MNVKLIPSRRIFIIGGGNYEPTNTKTSSLDEGKWD